MKKFIVTFFAIICIVFTLSFSASAARMDALPITVVGMESGTPEYFTLTSVELSDVYLMDNYTKDIYLNIHGYFGSDVNQSGSIALELHCYDSFGTYIGKYDFTAEGDYLYSNGDRFYFNVPDVTASVEIVAKNPAAWSNTYYYCKYKNVYADDGRALGVHDMLVPVYEKVGWHGDVLLYALDGRTLKVPYCDVNAYKKVGWYDYTDYKGELFRQSYRNYVESKDYNSIINLVNNNKSTLAGTKYESELYAAKTYAMDSWRKQINGPLAIVSQSVSKYGNKSRITITFRNVSNMTIRAGYTHLTNANSYGSIVQRNQCYMFSNVNIAPGETYTCFWDVSSSIKSIVNSSVYRVVYSNGYSWNE